MREGLRDVMVFMTSRPIRFIRQVIGNGQLGFSEEFFYGLCPDILPGIYNQRRLVKHFLYKAPLEDT